jgi:VWFA-related protein
VPRRFVALYFDDVNTPIENLGRARDAADHFLTTSIQPVDRVALYTASGQKQLDFTDDVAQVHQALLDLRWRPIVSDDRPCGPMPAYEAYLVVYGHDSQAIDIATEEILNCLPCSKVQNPHETGCLKIAQNMVQSKARESLEYSETQSTAALRGIDSVVRRMTTLPGQRSIVIVSAGFQTDTLHFDLQQITDRSLRAGVILNALDARGLYTSAAVPDASQHSVAYTSNPSIIAMKSPILVDGAKRQIDGIQTLALDTGGIFFNNSNDLEAGFHNAAAVPETFYLLAFSPQNLKLDGNFHPIQVKLVSAKGLSVQARRGYYAPKKPTDPGAREKEEIQEAAFSPGETRTFPIDVQTQFFVQGESDTSISVVTRVDLSQLHLRKEGDRNLDNLTFVTVLFDQDGHLVNGQQKSVDLHLRDDTLEKYLQTGIASQSRFDVKRGTYMVRAIVRDSESGQISALNRTVEIPY